MQFKVIFALFSFQRKSSDDYRGDRNNSANGAGVGGSGGIGDGNVGLIGESMDTTGTLTSADFRPR